MKEKLNIGGKIEYHKFSSINTIAIEMRKLLKEGKLKVKITDAKKVRDYLLNRIKQRELRLKQCPFRCQTFKELKSNFIKALSEPLVEQELNFGIYSELEIDYKRKKAILDFLNFRAGGGFRERENFDLKNRGDFVKFNILLLDTERKLAVIQGFQYLQWKSKEHSTSRKNYYLVGLTEEGRAFTHVLTGQIAWKLQDLWRSGQNWYEAFLKWAFGFKTTENLIIQGDVALCPVKPQPLKFESVTEFKINGSHVIFGLLEVDRSKQIVKVTHDRAYLVHLRNQHETKTLQVGYYKYSVMKEGSLWNFSKAIRD